MEGLILLLSLCGLLHGHETQIAALQECCEVGRAMAQREQDCAVLPRFTSLMCSITREQCCRSAAEAFACSAGVQTARGQQPCERPFFPGSPWRTQTSKICCDCCVLGLMAADRGLSCSDHGLALGRICNQTAKACCEQPGGARPTAHAAVRMEEPDTDTAPNPERNNSCRDSNCTQLCVGNGVCACNEGFHLKTDGVTCEDVDECTLRTHSCGAGFVCINTAGSFSCQLTIGCGDGYVQNGAGSCVDVNECETLPSPCQPGWTCVNTMGSYDCYTNTITCSQGYNPTVDGTHCEDVNECLTGSHSCVHGQVCLNTPGSFYCQSSCGPGFLLSDSDLCEDIDECAVGSHGCEPDSDCINTAGSFSCRPKTGCEAGFVQAPAGGCVDVNECLVGGVCGGHVCTNLEGSYRCECRDGFMLNSLTQRCEDVNECRRYSRRPCAHRCENTEGSFLCSCIAGFKLAVDGRNCEDVNECLTGIHDCAEGKVCINTEGSFRCQTDSGCGSGYKLLDHSCLDVNECVALPGPCQPGQTCINTIGSFSCRSNAATCGRGYHMTADGTHCEDVNECLVGDVCVGHGCVNLEGSFRCECRAGYAFNRVSKLCEDVNECQQLGGRLCAHRCENTRGSYLCRCAAGFKLAADGVGCEDVDECERRPCSQECANVFGSFQCYCHPGFQLSDADGVTCQDIDECQTPNACSYRCLNSPGGFNCTCPPGGFTLGPDGRSCQDVDECSAGTHSCSASESCVNVQGGFRCLFFECPPNFRRAASGSGAGSSALVRCVKSCRPQDPGCLQDPVHILTSTVLSLPTLQDLREPEEIVFLRTAAPARAARLPQEPDVYFEIASMDEQQSFDVVKRSHRGVVIGVIRQLKPVVGPRALVLEVTMNYVQSGVISQKNIVIIHVFISEFWF
ncbi:fibulin-1-like [Menidia menidia]